MNNVDKKHFVIDANIFIEAYKRYYGLDLCPGFWNCLAHYCQPPQFRLLSIDRVQHEIYKNADALKKWVQQAPADLFVSTNDQSIVTAYQKIISTVQNSTQFSDAAKTEFANVADGWLVAFAQVRGFVLVTDERFNQDIKSRIPIPNVCRDFDVEYVNTFAFLRSLEVRFDWEP